MSGLVVSDFIKPGYDYEVEMSPKTLSEEFCDYRERFDDFTLDHLLKIKEIEARTNLAVAIGNFSEEFFEEMNRSIKDLNRTDFGIAGAVDNIADSIREAIEAIKED